MWSDNKSLILSKVCVILFMALQLTCAIFAPRLVSRLMSISMAAYRAGAGPFLWTLYIGCIPAAMLLASMFRLLQRIGAGDVFVKENVSCLRFISYCFFFGGVICIVSAFYYAPWLPIGIMAIFMGLVVRVVKNVISKAVSLQDDADYTI